MNVDRVLGVGAVFLAILIGAVSWGFGVGSPKSPGAGFWPLLISMTMVGLGLSLIWQPVTSVEPESGESRWGKLGLCLGALAFYAVALEPLGYLLTTAVMLFVQFRWVESQSWRSSACISISAAVITLMLFRVLLKVTLPAGVIPLPMGW